MHTALQLNRHYGNSNIGLATSASRPCNNAENFLKFHSVFGMGRDNDPPPGGFPQQKAKEQHSRSLSHGRLRQLHAQAHRKWEFYRMLLPSICSASWAFSKQSPKLHGKTWCVGICCMAKHDWHATYKAACSACVDALQEGSTIRGQSCKRHKAESISRPICAQGAFTGAAEA